MTVKINKYKELLRNELEKHNITIAGDLMFFGYNPPFQLVNRLNEVAVEIRWKE